MPWGIQLAVSDELFSEYMTWTSTSLSEFETLLTEVSESPSKSPNNTEGQPMAEKMYAISHNIKGMGASFGFPLMTDLGDTLCHYLKDLPENSAISVSIISAHLKAMKAILDNRIEGEGGEMGENLKIRIAEIIKKHS